MWQWQDYVFWAFVVIMSSVTLIGVAEQIALGMSRRK